MPYLSSCHLKGNKCSGTDGSKVERCLGHVMGLHPAGTVVVERPKIDYATDTLEEEAIQLL